MNRDLEDLARLSSLRLDLAAQHLAIASLYRAASGVQPWGCALQAAASFFESERVDLAVRSPTTKDRFQLAASSNEGVGCTDLARAPSQSGLAAVVKVPLDRQTQAFAAFRWPRSVVRDPLLNQELLCWAEHLRVALQLSRHHSEANTIPGLLQMLLDARPNATWILDADRTILFANRAAQAAGCDVWNDLPRPGGRLTLRNWHLNKALTTLLNQLTRFDTRPYASLDLRADQTAAPLHLHVRRQRAQNTHAPTRFVVSAFANGITDLSPLRDINRSLGLTDAEARVAELLASGHSPDDIARLNGTGISTVRTQLVQVFRKLGVSSQRDVVRLLCQNQSLWRLMAA